MKNLAKRLTIAGTLAFAIVSVIVIFGGLKVIDAFVSEQLSPLAGSFFVYLTEFGSVKVLIGTSLFGMLYFFWRKDRAEAIRLPVVVIGTLILTQILKRIFSIDRPLIDAALDATTYSFPSGHASGSIALYGLLAIIFYRRSHAFGWIVFFITLVIFVSFSRVILNVHYFSDVLGGWIVGLTVIAGSEWILRRIRS